MKTNPQSEVLEQMLGKRLVDEEFQNLVLGALLHDVGKLWQRTVDADARKRVEREYDWFTPRGRPGVTHSKWGAYFVKEHYSSRSTVENMVLRHHDPEDDLERIIQIADHLSAGEREATGESREVAAEPLVDIFSRISGVKAHAPDDTDIGYVPLTSLNLSRDDLIPTLDKDQALSENSYAEAFDSLSGGTEQAIQASDGFTSLLLRTYHQLWAHTSSVPSAVYGSIADISLFDHSRMTAALAACLYQMYRQGEVNSSELEKGSSILTREDYDGPVRFMLIGGDLSGVQDFIYDVSAAGAAKGLRGRSLHLMLLTEAVVHHTLKQLSLPFVNTIYSAGGRFYLLAPASSESEFEGIRREVNEALLERYGGGLGVVMESVTLTPADFSLSAFGEQWSRLGLALKNAKLQKMQDLLSDRYDTIFGPYESGGAQDDYCLHCGMQLTKEEDELCHRCVSLQRLSQQAARAEYLTVSDEISEGSGQWATCFEQMGVSFDFSGSPPADDRFSFALNDTDFLPSGADGFRFICNHTPFSVEGFIKEFDAMAQDAEGLNRWAILRADVDDLGLVFGRGLAGNQSLSRYATLSRRLELFFSGWMNELAGEFADQSYVIYSGGDDLFVVGGWDAMPDLAYRIEEDFKSYCSRSPHLSISCGIFLPPSVKYPLRMAAEGALQSLDGGAKKFSRIADGDEISKDAVDFLGSCYGWESAPYVRELKDVLVSLLNPADDRPAASRALLGVIGSALGEHEMAEKEGETAKLWRFIYAIKRMAERHPQRSDDLMQLENLVMGEGWRIKEGVSVALRWAEFLTRK